MALALPDSGMTEDAVVFQISCYFQSKEPLHFTISNMPKRERMVFIKSSKKYTVV